MKEALKSKPFESVAKFLRFDNTTIFANAGEKARRLFRSVSTSYSIGMEFCGARVRQAHVEELFGKVNLVTIDSNVKPIYNQNEITGVAIPAADVLVRKIELKLTKKSEIDAVIPFQIEPHLPYPIEECLLKWNIVSVTDEGASVVVFAVKKTRLTELLEKWKTGGLDPETAYPAQIALQYLAETRIDCPQDSFFWIHCGSDEIICMFLKNKRVLAARSFLRDDDNAACCLEVSRTLFAMQKQLKTASTECCALSGDYPDALRNAVGLKQFLHVPVEGVFAVAAGVAHAVVLDTARAFDFRIDELAYKDPWKRLKASLLSFYALGTAAAVALVLFTSSYEEKRLAEIQGQYAELLVLLNKPYPQTEGALYLTKEELLNRLGDIEGELASKPGSYPLVPGVPRVSDVLAWLCTHPQICSEDGGPLILESFSYMCDKRPDQNKRSEKYRVRVDLEFSAATPKAAREFHDALIAPNFFVDPAQEVKWSTNRGKYNASFYLKDRTVYF